MYIVRSVETLQKYLLKYLAYKNVKQILVVMIIIILSSLLISLLSSLAAAALAYHLKGCWIVL